MASNATNSLLLFGDYGPEVIRLSQLYQPTKARYRMVEYEKPKTGATYYLPTVKKRTITFSPVTTANLELTAAGKFARSYWEEKPNWSATDQNGNYVPETQTLVVVDRDDDDRWGTYTLLVVDSVDNGEGKPTTYAPTYESVLVPINFSGDIGSSSRAIDYENNKMMLYVDNVTIDATTTAQRLVPDRKLMMYGSRSMRYVIRKTINGIDAVICTNSLTGGHADKQEYIGYFSAAGVINGALVQVTDVTTFKSLNGKTVEYFDAFGNKKRVGVTVVTDTTTGELVGDSAALFAELKACYDRGENLIVHEDTSDILENVQIPNPSYLRTSVGALTSGEIVEFMAYETTSEDGGLTSAERLVFATKLTVRAGSSLSLDSTQATIVGFDVRLDALKAFSDTWNIGAMTSAALAEQVVPVLKLDNGSEIIVDKESGAYYVYGMEVLDAGVVAGSEFDILFKYYPTRKIGLQGNTALDARYTKVTLDQTDVEATPDAYGNIILKQKPSATRQYYTKNANTGLYVIVGSNGHPTGFIKGVDYYTNVDHFAWDDVTSRPMRQMLVCRKRVTIQSSTVEGVNKIIMVPVWNESTLEYSYKFLVYREDLKRSPYYTTDDDGNGCVIASPVLPDFPDEAHRNGSKNTQLVNPTLYFKPKDSANALTNYGKKLTYQLQHFTSNNSELNDERWLFLYRASGAMGDLSRWSDTDTTPYGRQNPSGEKYRPYLLCTPGKDAAGDTYGTYRVDPTIFVNCTPGTEMLTAFIENFYRAILSADDTFLSSKTPTHFVIRSVDEDEVETTPIQISTETDPNAFCAPVLSYTLPIPDETKNKIVVMEFLYYNGGVYDRLVGIPVEVKYSES